MFAKLFELRDKKLKDNKKKGFTLVELIVVLVILAILAALLIPALTGYINKARRKSIVAETRQVVMAAQTLADEEYAKASVGDATITFGDSTKTITFDSVKELSEAPGTIESITADKNGVVTSVVYSNSGKYCEYSSTAKSNSTDGKYNVTDKKPSTSTGDTTTEGNN